MPRFRGVTLSACSSTSWIALFARASMLLVGSALLGGGITVFRLGGLPRPPAQATSCQAPHVEPQLIGPAEAAQLCAGGALVADARSAAEYTAGHVADAVHLPCDSKNVAAATAISQLAERSHLLVYGSSTEQAVAVARSVAQRVGDRVKVYALRGGFAAWERAGLACASGPCESCISSEGH